MLDATHPWAELAVDLPDDAPDTDHGQLVVVESPTAGSSSLEHRQPTTEHKLPAAIDNGPLTTAPAFAVLESRDLDLVAGDVLFVDVDSDGSADLRAMLYDPEGRLWRGNDNNWDPDTGEWSTDPYFGLTITHPDTYTLVIEQKVSTDPSQATADDPQPTAAQPIYSLEIETTRPGPELDGQKQVVYLDFDGEENAVYNGPITVGPFDVPAFSGEPFGLAGHEAQLIAEIAENVRGIFADLNIEIVTERPGEGPYSTVYVGGGDSAFHDYGSFRGIAEIIDVGNQNPADSAFVFSDETAGSGDDPAKAVASPIAHEAGHLIGLSHVSEGVMSARGMGASAEAFGRGEWLTDGLVAGIEDSWGTAAITLGAGVATGEELPVLPGPDVLSYGSGAPSPLASVASDGQPWMDWFEVNGDDISNGGTDNWGASKIVGAGWDVWVVSQWSNIGDDNSGHGGVAMAFPDYEYYSDLGIDTSSDFVYEGGSWSGQIVKWSKEKGDPDLYTIEGGPYPASHLTFEGDDTEWDGTDNFNDEEHKISVRIHTPPGSQQIKVTVRGSMSDSNWDNANHSPKVGSANGDQQGWPTLYFYIYVDDDGPNVPGSLDMTDSYDKGADDDDEITRESNPRFEWSKPSDVGYNSSGTSGTDDYYYWAVTPDGSSSILADEYTSSTNVRPGSRSDGDYTFWVRARDEVGNWGAWANIDYTVDTVDPNSPTGLTNPANPTPDTTPNVTWSAPSGTGSGIWKYEIHFSDGWGVGAPDRSYWSSNTTLNDYEFVDGSGNQYSLPEGDWSWKARAWDVAGNQGSWSGERSLTVHTNVAPNAPSFNTTPPSAIYPTKTYTVTVDYTDPDGQSDLQHVCLRLAQGNNESNQRQTMMYSLDTGWKGQWSDEGQHISSLSTSKSSITNGWRVTWTFSLDDTWNPSSDVDYYAWSFDFDATESPHTKNNRNASYDNGFEIRDARITNSVDQDGDGYARQLDIEFNVDSNISGSYFVKVYESDLLFDDYLLTSSTFSVSGTATEYHGVTIVTDSYGLYHGTAEFKLELYDASTGQKVQTWTGSNDTSLDNVRVEYASEDDRISEIVLINGVLYDLAIQYHYSANQGFDPGVRTWIVSHGRGSSPTDDYIHQLGEAVAGQFRDDQVLMIDWSNAAADLVTVGEDRIEGVAAWAAGVLSDRGFLGTTLNLIGHSWGAYVAAELAEEFVGGVSTIVGLDPARNGVGSWNPNDPNEIHFARDSELSWAFYSEEPEDLVVPIIPGRNFGNESTPTTADEAFVVKDSSHEGVVQLFTYMLKNPSGGVSQLFQLDRLLRHERGPWVQDQYNFLGEPDAGEGYEAVIEAASGGTSPEQVTYFSLETPSVFIDNVQGIEGDHGAASFVFTVSLSQSSTQTVTVDYATASGTATAGSDYTPTSDTLTFSPNVTSQQVTVSVIGDTLVEMDETFFLNLSNASKATIADGEAQGKILNDDLPSLSITDVEQSEGDTGTVGFVFTLDLSQASPHIVEVNYATADDTATAGTDFAAVNGALTFDPSVTSRQITVPVLGDTLVEMDETFFLNLSAASGAILANNRGNGTILNDDLPSLSINDVSRLEGDSGTENLVFTVSLSQPSAQTVRVNYVTANGTAQAGSDYFLASGSLIFDPGITSLPVTVAVIGDTSLEANETFFVDLSGAEGATIGHSRGQGSIQNDDSAYLTIDDVQQQEGDSGTTNFTFTVDLSQPSAQTVRVSYATVAGTATADSDYYLASGELVFSTGTVSLPITVAVIGDSLVEANETFYVNLSGPVGATIADSQGLGTIQDDDSAYLSIDDVRRSEGDSGTTDFVFTVSLSPSSTQTVEVSYAAVDGSAAAGSDYGPTSGVLTFTPGNTTQQVIVSVNGDTMVEGNETFYVDLSNAIHAAIGQSRGTGTIENDDVDQLPTVTSLAASPDPVAVGGAVTLTATASDVDGSVQSVKFWHDANLNGYYNPGDPLLGIDTDGSDGWTWTTSATTGSAGTVGYLAAAVDNDGHTSDTLPATGQVVALGEIRGKTWHDADGDGVWDTGELGLQGWRMYLDEDNDGNWDAGEPSRLTDATGAYAFTELAAGTYVVAEVAQGGWTQTFPTPVPPGKHTVLLGAGEVRTGSHFGNQDQTAPESTLVGVDFEDGSFTTPLNWALFTGGTGLVTLSDLTDESGASTPYDLTIDGSFSNDIGRPDASQLPAHSQPLAGLDGDIFGTSPATFTWADLEPLVDYEVYVFGLDAGPHTQNVDISGNSGTVAFVQTCGPNALLVNDEVGDSGRDLSSFAEVVTSSSSGTITIQVTPVGTYLGLGGLAIRRSSAGSYGEIHGSKWYDQDGDGVWDTGESGVEGWTIYIDENRNGQLDAGEPSDVTDATGAYALTGLAPDTYTVVEEPQQDWEQTFPASIAGTGELEFVEQVWNGKDGVDGLDAANALAMSPDGNHVYVAACDDDALAVFGRDGTTGALSFVQVVRNGQAGVDGLDGTTSVTLSPDGNHVYATGERDSALVVFSREAATGALTFVQVVKDGEGGVDGLSWAWTVAVSPDGSHVYVVGANDHAVAAFSRDATTGALTFVQVLKDGQGGVDGVADPRGVTVSPDGSHVYVAGSGDDAVAVFGRDGATGALTFVQTVKEGQDGVDGLEGPWALTVSPDGGHLYVAGSRDHALAVFGRGAATGELTFVQVVEDNQGGVDGLLEVSAVTVSADGKHVYAAGPGDNAVAAFARDSATGKLAFVEMIRDGQGGADGLHGSTAVVVSPDGSHLYAVGRSDDAVVVFSRESVTGQLSFVEYLWDGQGGVHGLDSVTAVTVSPDGRHAYSCSEADDALVVFVRDEGTGELSFVETAKDDNDGVDGLNGAAAITVSPDGGHVYVAGYYDNALAVFSRDPASGEVTFVQKVTDGEGGVDGLRRVRAVAVSPDGSHVYGAGEGDDAVAVFSRDATTGELTFVGMVKDGQDGVDGLDGASALTMSPDGGHVYATGYIEDALAVFSRDGATGELTFVHVLKDDEGGVDGLNWPTTVTIGPDGGHVYAAGYFDHAVAVFSRDRASGELTFVEVVKQGQDGADGLNGPRAVTVSPDGNHIHVAGYTDDAVAVFSRDDSTGELAFVQVVKDGQAGVDGVAAAKAVALSPDGDHVYVAGSGDDAVAVFSRDGGRPGVHEVVLGAGEIVTGKDFGNEFSGTLDFGDAPDPTYPTLLTADGARHVLGSGLCLGTSVDAETDGLPDPNAVGDDNAGDDDEDGARFTSVLRAGGTATVEVTASGSGLLNAWIDFNGDGDWDDAGEQIFTDVSVTAGPNSLSFTVPDGAAGTAGTFGRFRLSGSAGLPYDGLAIDGEVEDYRVPIVSPDIDVTDNQGPTADHAIAFGNVNRTSSSQSYDVTVANVGTDTLGITSLMLSDTTNYSVAWDGDGLAPSSVAAGASRVATITFDATVAGVLPATFTINSDDPDESGVVVALSGTGIEQDIDVTDNQGSTTDHAIAFGSVNRTSGFQSYDVAAANVGTDALGISSIVLSDTTNYSVAWDGDGNAPASITAGNSRVATITFDPAALGAMPATLVINSNDPDEPSVVVALSGTGVEQDIDVTDNQGTTTDHAVAFGDVNRTSGSQSYDVTVANVGTDALGISSIVLSDTTNYSVAWDGDGAVPTSLAAGSSRIATLTFGPSVLGALPATFTINSDDPDESSVVLDLSGTGVEQGLGEIHGSKWNDLDGDGQRDAGEPGLADWTIYLDENGNGQVDTGEPSTVTDSNGEYAFTGLAPSTYQVAEVPQPGWVQAFPGAGTPDYAWTDTFGGTGADLAIAVAVDQSGNVYVTGAFMGEVDFDPSADTDRHTAVGFQDIFVTKFAADGSYGWTRTMGGSSFEYPADMAIDDAGNIYVVGDFMGTVDFDPSAATDERSSQGDYDVFVTKLGADGSYGWTRALGGTLSDVGYGVDVTSDGHVYFTGHFQGTVDFNPLGAPSVHTSNGVHDVFITQVQTDGTYGWTRTMGGSLSDHAYGIAAGPDSSAYVVGQFRDTVDLDPTGGTQEHISNGESDIFVTRLFSDGSFGQAWSVGGTGTDYALDAGTDSSGILYLTGWFESTDVDFDPTAGLDIHSATGGFDIFVSQFLPDGSYGWTRTIGGTTLNEGRGEGSLWVDPNSNVYVTGPFRGTMDFDPTDGVDSRASAGALDLFLTQLHADGTYGWTWTGGGSYDEVGRGVVIDPSGNVLAVGGFHTPTDFDPTTGVDQRVSSGSSDAFITKLLLTQHKLELSAHQTMEDIDFGNWLSPGRNQAPVAFDGTLTVAEDGTGSGTVVATDADTADTLTYSAVANPTHGSLTLNPDGTFTYAPTTNYNGADSFTFQTNDGHVDSNVATVTITVTPVNDGPVLATNTGLTVDEGANGAIGNTKLNVTDVDVPAQTLTFTLVAGVSHGTLALEGLGALSAGDTFTQVDIDGGKLSYTHNGGAARSDSFVFSVSDGDGGAVSDESFRIEVSNLPPRVGADNATVGADEGQTASNTGTHSDPGVDDVMLSASIGVITDNGNGTWSWSFGTSDGPDENQTVTITATDSDIAVTTATFSLVVSNVAPEVDAGVDQTVGEGDTVGFSATVSDAGSADTHSMAWDFGDGTTVSGTLTPSHVYSDNGVYTVSLTVTDDDGAAMTDTLSVTVSNVPPVADAGNDLTVVEGDTVGFSGAFTDGGSGDTHTIEWAFGDGGTANGTLTPTHVYVEDGVYTVTLTVTDDDGAAATDTLDVTVSNAAPVVDAGSDQNANEGEEVSFSGSFIDAGTADTHTTAWNFGDGSTASGTLTPMHAYADDGVYTVSLTVTDDDGGATDDWLTVSVSNVAPIANDDDAITTEDASLDIDVLSNDTDVGVNDLLCVVSIDTNGTTGSVAVGPAGRLSYNPNGQFESLAVGQSATDTFGYTVSDTQGATDTAVVTVTITGANDAPVAQGAAFTVNEDESHSGTVSATDVDNGATWTYHIVAGPSHGAIGGFDSQTGGFTYAPSHNYCGPDSFTFRANDGRADSNVATVAITVAPVNDAPVIDGLPDKTFDEDSLVAAQAGQTWEGEDVLRQRLGYDRDTVQYLGYDGDAGLAAGAGPTGDVTPTGSSYLAYEYWGGDWVDAEKSPTNGEDDLMCWAAAAANVLEWTGWGQVDGMTDTDDMFEYFQDHWTDEGGIMRFGWDWWFDGTNSSQGWDDWSQVDVAGGGFYPSESFFSHYRVQSNDSFALAAIDQYLHAGYGVAIGVYNDPYGHAITSWGVNYNPDDPSDYYGIWVTDSDDDKRSGDPPDRLRYYEVEEAAGQWYLQGFYGSDDWHIGAVQALENAGNRIDLWSYAWDVETADEGLSFSIVGNTDPSCGVSIHGNRYVLIDPEADWYGISDVTIQVTDGQLTDTDMITITVNSVNDPPVAHDDVVGTDEDTPVVVDVLGNDTDVDGDTLSVDLVTDPAHGSVVVSQNGTVTYTPTADFYGTDVFSYVISDGNGGTDTGQVTVVVEAVNDAPSFMPGGNVSVDENAGLQTFADWATNMSVGPANESAQAISFLVSNGDNTLFSSQPAIANDGTLTFTPAADAYGEATVTVAAMDDGGTANGGADTSAAQSFTIAVNPVLDASDPRVTYRDRRGNRVTFTYTGQGVRIVLSGTGADGELRLSGGSSSRPVAVESITGTGVGRIYMPYANVQSGGIHLTDGLGDLTVRDIADGAEIEIGGGATDRLTLNARQVGDVDLEFAGVLTSATVEHWLDGSLVVGEVGRLSVRRGTLGADVFVAGGIANVTVKRGICGDIVTGVVGPGADGLYGTADDLLAAASDVDASGDIGRIYARRDISGNLIATGSLRSVQAGRNISGTIVVGRDGRNDGDYVALRAGGRITGEIDASAADSYVSMVYASGDLGTETDPLRISAGGNIQTVLGANAFLDLTSGGSVANVAANQRSGQLTGSVTAADDITGFKSRGGIAADFVAGGTISRLTARQDLGSGDDPVRLDAGGDIRDVRARAVYAEVTSDGDITRVSANRRNGAIHGALTASGSITRVTSTGSITSHMTAGGSISNVFASGDLGSADEWLRLHAGGDIVGIGGASLYVDLVAGGSVASVTASQRGGQLVGSINASRDISGARGVGQITADFVAGGRILRVSARQDLGSSDDLVKLDAGGGIRDVRGKSVYLNATSGGDIQRLSATGRDGLVDGALTATGSIMQIRSTDGIAARMTAGGSISQVFASGDLGSAGDWLHLDATGSVVSIVGANVYVDVASGAHVTGVTATQRGSQLSGEIAATGNINTIMSKGSMTADLDAEGSILKVTAGDDIGSTGNPVTLEAGGDIRLIQGESIYVAATSGGSIRDLRSTHSNGQLAGSLSASGSIMSVKSAGGITADMTAQVAICHVSAGKDVGAAADRLSVEAGGDIVGISGSNLYLSATAGGSMRTVTARQAGGTLAGSLKALGDMVGVTSGGTIAADLIAGHDIAGVHAACDITGTLVSGVTAAGSDGRFGTDDDVLAIASDPVASGHMRSVRAGWSITGDLIATGSLQSIIAGRDITGKLAAGRDGRADADYVSVSAQGNILGDVDASRGDTYIARLYATGSVGRVDGRVTITSSGDVQSLIGADVYAVVTSDGKARSVRARGADADFDVSIYADGGGRFFDGEQWYDIDPGVWFTKSSSVAL